MAYDDIYEPIDANPNVDHDANFMNAVQPMPGPGDDHASQPDYSQVPAPSGVPGTLPAGSGGARQMLRFLPAAHSHLRGALLGVAGAALASCFGRKKASLNASRALKGALGGAVACWATAKKAPSLPCTIAAVGGGYATAKLWR